MPKKKIDEDLKEKYAITIAALGTNPKDIYEKLLPSKSVSISKEKYDKLCEGIRKGCSGIPSHSFELFAIIKKCLGMNENISIHKLQTCPAWEFFDFLPAGMRTIAQTNLGPTIKTFLDKTREAWRTSVPTKLAKQDTNNVATPISAPLNLQLLHHRRAQDKANNILRDRYPPSDLDNFAEANNEVWITGYNLRRIFPNRMNELAGIIERGGTLNAILLSRESDAVKYAAQQDWGLSANVTRYLETISTAEECLRDLKQLKKPNQVNIKWIDYPLPFGIDAVDIESPNGIICVLYYPLYSGRGDAPVLVLRPNQSQWYSFYKRQLKIQWTEYACLYNAGWDLRIDRTTDELAPAIAALANKVSLSKLSEEERKNGFLIPYSVDQYKEFSRHAEHFYVLRHRKQLIGFVLAHSSEHIGLFEEEVYLHIKTTQTPPYIVIRQICIDPAFSDMGHGKALYEFLFKSAEIDTARYRKAICFIWKRPSNPKSERFHRSEGWNELEPPYTLTNGEGEIGVWERAIQRFD